MLHIKKTILLFCAFHYFYGAAQNAKALTYFNEGVANFNAQNYRKADSLFTLSNNLELTSETVFNRAICRGKMADKTGYCTDLVKASSLGENRATQLFLKTCGKIDTVFIPVIQTYSPARILSRKITYTFNDSIHLVLLQKYYGQERVKKDSISADTTLKQKPSADKAVEVLAEFPGGMTGLMNYIRKNIRIPRSLSSKTDSPTVFLKFIIDNDGSIHDIVVLKGIPGCDDCSEEATRLVAAMPTWKPASLNGTPVKIYFNLPVSFRTYN